MDGAQSVGGLLGYGHSGTISNSYSTSSVTSTDAFVGGLVGRSYSGTIISNSYSIGLVNGVSNIGGLVGISYSSPITNSFWDTETSNQSSSSGGTGKTTTEMKSLATFTDESNAGLDAAWDFETNPNDDNANSDYWGIDRSYPI